MACVIGTIHIEAVQSSLETSVDEMRPGDALTALMRAALTGQTSAVIALIDRGAEANARDDHGRTPLMEAGFGGHTDTIKALIERGADVNLADDNGWTALMEAASKGYHECVILLLAHNANVNARTKQGWTALKATAKGNLAIMKLLKESVGSRQ